MENQSKINNKKSVKKPEYIDEETWNKLPIDIKNKVMRRRIVLDKHLDFDCKSPQEIIDNLNIIIGSKSNYSNLLVIVERNYDDGEDFYMLVGDRIESDDEHIKRIKCYIQNKAINDKHNKIKENREKKELERLIKKHGIPDVIE